MSVEGLKADPTVECRDLEGAFALAESLVDGILSHRRERGGPEQLLTVNVGPLSVSMQNLADPWYDRFSRRYEALALASGKELFPEPDPRVCIFMSIPSRMRSCGGSFQITAFYRPNSDMFRLYESSVKCFLELPSLVSPEEIAYLDLPEEGPWIQTQWELVRQMKHAQTQPEGWESLHRPPYGRIDRTR